MYWWLAGSLLCLLFYFSLAFKLFFEDYNYFREEGLKPEYEDIKSMLITALLWPVFAAVMLWDDLLFNVFSRRGSKRK